MGFPSSVKEQMLVAAARHCCVCHRFKGVKVEVHHIVQEADGGANTIDNAIPLCFDCHSDAGHYNPRHPRGTKFSPSELKQAKDFWLEIVRTKDIDPPEVPDHFLCRYYVCKNFEILSDITRFNLDKFPVPNAFLFKNHVFFALKDIVRRHPSKQRNSSAWGRKFPSKEEYLKIYPDMERLPLGEIRYPYFNEVRTASSKELEQFRLADGVVNAMLEHEIPVSDSVSVVGCYEAGCEGIEFQEEYIFRELWCSFLSIKNISDKPAAIQGMMARISKKQGFATLDSVPSDKQNINLPHAPIDPGSTVLIPVAVVLPPLHPIKVESSSFVPTDGTGDYYQAVSHCAIDPKLTTDFLIYGGAVMPDQFLYTKSSTRFQQAVHEFDLTNFYEIDMHWGCGSCPHLFFKSDHLNYVRELLAHCENNVGNDGFAVPAGVDRIVIAEVEDEVTQIVSLRADGKEFACNLVLTKGQCIEISVKSGTFIELIGQYVSQVAKRPNFPTGRFRNSLIHEFLSTAERSLTRLIQPTQ